MKKLLLICALCFSVLSFSQQNETDDTEKKNMWEVYSNPSTSNFITKHFENTVDAKLLNRAKLTSKKKVVAILFNLDENNSIINLKTNSKDKKLTKALLNSFNTIPFDSLKIKEKSVFGGYSIQVIKLENNKPIFKASSICVDQRYPIFQGCENETNFVTLVKCNQANLASYIVKNFDITLGPRTNLSGVAEIYAIFKIDKDSGKFTDINVKAPNTAIQYEVKKLLYNFPACSSKATINGKPVSAKYSLPIKYPIPSNTKKNE